MEQIPACQRRIEAKPLRWSVNGERGVEATFGIGDRDGDRHHRFVKFFPVEAEPVTADVAQFVGEPVCIHMRVWRQPFEF